MLNHLKKILIFLALQSPLIAFAESNEYSDGFSIDKEVFELGLIAGSISIEDFPSEFIWGVNASFLASESFFLQYNYVQTSVSRSAFENNIAFTTLNLGPDRNFKHYDLLLGYKLLQTEYFTKNNNALIGAFYSVVGVGNTEFGNEENFSYTVGLGYNVELSNKIKMIAEYKQYIYETNLITGQSSTTAIAAQFSLGLNYLF